MPQQQIMFVVVDPNNEQHVALELVALTAHLQEVKPFVRVFVAVDADDVDTRAHNTRLVRDLTWFDEKIHNVLDNAGVEYSVEVSWSSEWQTSIMQSAKR